MCRGMLCACRSAGTNQRENNVSRNLYKEGKKLFQEKNYAAAMPALKHSSAKRQLPA